ncbi:hypothetical protein ID866_6812 [Astraeus odoratus]|nr:hypothetical protein ID866_6812 [Astraeus odoratus]
MLKGATRLAPPSAKQDLHSPVTTEVIKAIKSQLQDDDPFNTAFFTCLTTTFYSAVRVGEFMIKWLNAFNPLEHISPSGVWDDLDRNGLHTKVFMLPHMKLNPRGEEVHWAKQNGPTDPLEALTQHLTLKNPPAEGPLFTYKKGTGHRPLTRQAFISKLKKTAKAVGYHSIHGHGIRIGSTLEYLLCGIPFDIVKVKGCWASDAFQSYL